MKRIGLEELSAYVDGELGHRRRADVDAYLAEDADVASRLALYRRHDDSLRQALAPLAEFEPNETLIAALSHGAARRKWTRELLVAAAVFVMVTAGFGSWWFLDYRPQQRMLADLAHRAEVAHLTYMSRHKDLSDTAGQALLTRRLRQILGHDAAVPRFDDLGYHWIGGLLLGRRNAPAVLLVYRNQSGNTVSCYFSARVPGAETGYATAGTDRMNIVYRYDEKVGYAVMGNASPTVLMKFAERGYRAASR